MRIITTIMNYINIEIIIYYKVLQAGTNKITEKNNYRVQQAPYT